MRRVDPQARPRLVAIIANLRERIQEARLNSWLGEVEGLQTSLNAAVAKLAAVDRSALPRSGTADLGIPILGGKQ
ncbi:hypothetical protein [Rhodococcus koreensis]|uniref:hypothetical protein n=1 Tax=Rhodococcus koreensis TaxID=99653 RepID=UPI0036DB9328